MYTNASKYSWSVPLTQEILTNVNGKDVSFLPIAYISGTFVESQKNWATLIKEAFAIYLACKKLRNSHTTYMMSRLVPNVSFMLLAFYVITEMYCLLTSMFLTEYIVNWLHYIWLWLIYKLGMPKGVAYSHYHT